MSNKNLVPLYEGERIIGRVYYCDNLDHWDGRNYTCGSTGRHLGIGKTRAGKFFLVHGTQWIGEQDYAEVISETEAKQQVMSANNNKLYKEFFGEEIPLLEDDA